MFFCFGLGILIKSNTSFIKTDSVTFQRVTNERKISFKWFKKVMPFKALLSKHYNLIEENFYIIMVLIFLAVVSRGSECIGPKLYKVKRIANIVFYLHVIFPGLSKQKKQVWISKFPYPHTFFLSHDYTLLAWWINGMHLFSRYP